jgi:plasmid stability protein
MAAHNWRALRLRFADHGVGDVMAEVPSMHIVLDAIEQLGAEAATSGKKSETEARAALSSYFDKLYKPDMTRVQIDGSEYQAPPPGFSDEEVEASFDAFLNAGAG